MGLWCRRRSGGSSSSLLVFCIQLWEGGVGRGHFQLNTYLYITWRRGVHDFHKIFQAAYSKWAKAATRPLTPSCSSLLWWGVAAEWGNSPKTNCPSCPASGSGQEQMPRARVQELGKHREIIPLDSVSWLPVICCLRAYWPGSDSYITALNSPQWTFLLQSLPHYALA